MPGNLVVLQSGGCTAVMNASLAGVLRAAAESAAVGRVYGSHQGVRGLLRGELFDLTEQAPPLDDLRRTPAALLGSARHKLTEPELDRVLAMLRRLDIRYFHVIGGNDSADTGHRLAEAAARAGYELSVVTIPKTVDNDLPETDHVPGYGSAARFIAQVIMDAGRDTESISSVDPVKVIEVAGRDAGWLAAAGGLARRDDEDAPHLIYPPERPFSIDRFLDDVQRSYDRRGRAVVVASEALRDEATGDYLQADSSALYTDSFGHRQLGGAAAALCQAVAGRLGLKAKFDKPGTIQRMMTASHSEVDLAEAEAAGAHAVELAAGGLTGAMVTLLRVSDAPYRCELGHAPLDRIANRVRCLPAEYLTGDAHAVTDAYRAYADPLLGAPLPRYPRLRKVFAPLPSPSE
ncbi:MAG TPA: diphosphate--fructose-6-phosphate 1-phosphotransferase [Chloroflexota bacterium]